MVAILNSETLTVLYLFFRHYTYQLSNNVMYLEVVL